MLNSVSTQNTKSRSCPKLRYVVVSTAADRSTTRLGTDGSSRSEEHTSELQSHVNLVCRLLLEKKKKKKKNHEKEKGQYMPTYRRTCRCQTMHCGMTRTRRHRRWVGPHEVRSSERYDSCECQIA